VYAVPGVFIIGRHGWIIGGNSPAPDAIPPLAAASAFSKEEEVC
jgi:hypothetical protein